jgi:hypothetical protein
VNANCFQLACYHDQIATRNTNMQSISLNIAVAQNQAFRSAGGTCTIFLTLDNDRISIAP